MRLGHWFQTSAEFWVNLQSAYDIRLAAQSAGAEIDTLPVRPAQGMPARNLPAPSRSARSKPDNSLHETSKINDFEGSNSKSSL